MMFRLQSNRPGRDDVADGQLSTLDDHSVHHQLENFLFDGERWFFQRLPHTRRV
jgi:hypothetical protein